MNIRPVQEKDIPVVADLIVRNFDEVMFNYHSSKVINKFRSQMTPENLKAQMTWKRIFVVESNGEVIATGALVNFGTSDQPKHSVSNIFVKVERQNRGVGKFLMKHLLDTARVRGIEQLHVGSSLNAVTFYQRIGFEKDEAQPDVGDEITWMTKRL